MINFKSVSTIRAGTWDESIVFPAIDPLSSSKHRNACKIGLIVVSIFFTLATGGVGCILVYKLYKKYTLLQEKIDQDLKEIDEKAKDILQSAFKGHSIRNKFRKEYKSVISFQSALRSFLVRKEMKQDLMTISEDLKMRHQIKKAISSLERYNEGYVSPNLPFSKITLDIETLQGQMIKNTWIIDLDKVGTNTFLRNSDLPSLPLLVNPYHPGPVSISLREALKYLIDRINNSNSEEGIVNLGEVASSIDREAAILCDLTNIDYVSTRNEREYLSFLNAVFLILVERGHIVNVWKQGRCLMLQLPNAKQKLL